MKTTRKKALSLLVSLTTVASFAGLNATADTASTQEAVLQSSHQYTAISAREGYNTFFIPDQTYIQTQDGGMLAAVEEENTSDPDDRTCYAVKYNSNGSEAWHLAFDSDLGNINEVSDGHYVGYSEKAIYTFTRTGYDKKTVDGNDLGISDGGINGFAPDSSGGGYFIYNEHGTEGSVFDASGAVKIAKMDADGKVSVLYTRPGTQGTLRSLNFENGKLNFILINHDQSFDVITISTTGEVLSDHKMPKASDSSAVYFYSNLHAAPGGGYFICKDIENSNRTRTQIIEKLDENFNPVWTTNLNDTYMDYDVNSDGSMTIWTNIDSDWKVVTASKYSLQSAAAVNLNASPAKTISGSTTAGVIKSQVTSGDLAFLNPNDAVAINLGNVNIAMPVSILQANSISADLSFTQSASPQNTQDKIFKLVVSGTKVAESFDIGMEDTTNNTPIHQLGNEIQVTIKLSDAALAAITDPANAKIYYYDPETNSTTDMHAIIDLVNKTATFKTNHLSTYFVAQLPKSATSGNNTTNNQSPKTDKAANPRTSDDHGMLNYLIISTIGLGTMGTVLFTRKRKAC